MDAKEYKALSLKIGFNDGEPARKWEMYHATVVAELENYPEMRYDKKTYNLWKKNFNACYHLLPRDVNRLLRWYYSDYGIWGVVITENYKCGFFVSYDKNERTVYLKYENKNGEQVDKSFNNFSTLCNEANSLIGDNIDLFNVLGQSFSIVADAVKYYEECLIFEYPEIDGKKYTVCKENGNIIYKHKWHSEDLGWKI